MFKEWTLANDLLELKVTPEYGCHWTSLKVRVEGSWLDLLYPVPTSKSLPLRKWGGYGNYVLAPWSNRVKGGVFRFDNREHRLRINSRDHTAIHGDVMTRPWKVLSSSPAAFEAELDSKHFQDFNFPFPFRYHLRLGISGNRLTTGLWLTNKGSVAAPAGMGFHPYFKRRITAKDVDVEVTVPAEKIYPCKRCIPVGPAVPVTGKYDLRAGSRLGKRGLDDCYTELKPGPAVLQYPGTGLRVEMRADPVFNHMVVYAPDTWGGWGPPRPFVCVEPVTHANDGFNLSAAGWEETGVKTLEPGETWGGSFQMSVERAPTSV